MLSALSVVLPIFGLILAGYLCRRLGALGDNAASELNRFVVRLALPGLLFTIMTHTKWAALDQPGFAAAFGLSGAVVFALTVLFRLRATGNLADAGLDGLNAGYANSGFIGLPLCMIVFGRDSYPLATIGAIVTACVIFGIAIVTIEIGLQKERRLVALTLKVAGSLARNPLLVAPALGAAVAASGWALPASVETFLKLLSDAASPCALIALGLFLAQPRRSKNPVGGLAVALVAVKLILNPAVAWLLASVAFRLSPGVVHVAVLMSALPTGTGPFMLAEYYQREATTTSQTILLSTVVSVFTISAYLAWIR
ncbi:MAG: AEC family transporter [Hyphomicrobiales bacterium]|nr:AEC family transporter [Hyphomicrobiales bacterium]